MRILVCGDRNWKDPFAIADELMKYDNPVIIHGCATGADKFAGYVGKVQGFKVIEYPANWGTYKRGAGVIRNQLMIDDGKPDLVLAFHNDIDSSKGTKDMVNRAKKHGIEVKVITNE